MSLELLPAAPPEPELPTKAPPASVIALFVAFAKMSLAGFGGVLAFARRASSRSTNG